LNGQDLGQLSDRELLGRCLEGAPAAWDLFVNRFSGLIHQTIRATLRRYAADSSPDRLRDLFQQAFLALWEDDRRRLRGYSARNDCSVATWLRLVVARLVIDQLRRREPPTVPLNPSGEDREAGPGLDPPDPQPLANGRLAEKEAVNFLRSELEGLPARERLILKLRYEDGLSGAETARLLGLERNNVDQILHRIRTRLRRRAESAGLV